MNGPVGVMKWIQGGTLFWTLTYKKLFGMIVRRLSLRLKG
jgi:hypothetical protein